MLAIYFLARGLLLHVVCVPNETPWRKLISSCQWLSMEMGSRLGMGSSLFSLSYWDRIWLRPVGANHAATGSVNSYVDSHPMSPYSCEVSRNFVMIWGRAGVCFLSIKLLGILTIFLDLWVYIVPQL